jgi:hypothetical protein
MAKKIIIGIILICSFNLVFYFFKFLFSQSWFSTLTLSTELVPLDVINIIVTSIMAIFLAWYITKRLSEQRFKKEFIIGDLKNIEEQIHYIERVTNDLQKIQLQPLLDLLLKLETHIHRFNKSLEILHINCNESKKLDKYYTSLYIKATDVDGQELDIDSAKRNEIRKVCTKFVLATRSIIYIINKQ